MEAHYLQVNLESLAFPLGDVHLGWFGEQQDSKAGILGSRQDERFPKNNQCLLAANPH